MRVLEVPQAERGDAEQVVADVIEQHGRIDVLVNNDVLTSPEGEASAFDPVMEGDFEDLSTDDFRVMLEDLLIYPFALSKAAAPHMVAAGQGVMIFITSCNAIRPHAFTSMYNSARAGATNLAASIAKELGPRGVVVNSIGPTFYSNPTYFPEGRVEGDKLLQRRIEEDVPLRRLGTQAEMAALIGFLASGRTAPLTGEFLSFSGGWSI